MSCLGISKRGKVSHRFPPREGHAYLWPEVAFQRALSLSASSQTYLILWHQLVLFNRLFSTALGVSLASIQASYASKRDGLCNHFRPSNPNLHPLSWIHSHSTFCGTCWSSNINSTFFYSIPSLCASNFFSSDGLYELRHQSFLPFNFNLRYH